MPAPEPTICILYGFCEGPLLGDRLRQAFINAGLRLITDPAQADIIFAHSGGGFFIPPHHRAHHIILVGPPYWPNRSLLVSMGLKMWNDVHPGRRNCSFRRWLFELGCNLLYFWNMPANLRMLAGHQRGSIWQVRAPRLTLVRNVHDVFLTPYLATIPFRQPPHVVSLTGAHDDCYRNPQQYLSIVK